MCGRAYSSYSEAEIRARYLNKQPVPLPELKPNYNLSPTQTSLVVRTALEGTQLDLFRWGLVPFWAKELKIGASMINARSETVAEKPAFREAFKRRRCVVPLSGFIEWKRNGDSKRPFKIFQKYQPIMSMAGLWEVNSQATGEPVHTFTILTTAANGFMQKIHDRMPVILSPEEEQTWLSPDAEPVHLQKLLKPCPDPWLDAAEISTLINSPRNNRPEVLEPLPEPMELALFPEDQ